MATRPSSQFNKSVECNDGSFTLKDKAHSAPTPYFTLRHETDDSQAVRFAEDVLSRAFEIADENAQRALDLAGEINEFVPDVSEVEFPEDISTPIDFNRALEALNEILGNLADRPEFRNISDDLPSLGDLDDVPDIDEVIIGDFTGTAPDLSYPTRPIFEIGDIPLAPEILWPTVPTAPNWIEPDLPVFVDITIPSTPDVVVPTFDAILIDEELTAPSTTFDFNEEEYESDLLDALRTVLLRDLQNGSYGIEVTDEILMWQRAREREQMALNQGLNEALREWSVSGFSIPPGAALASVEKANQTFLEKTSSLNREQTLEHSNKYWDGKKFTMEGARQFEQMLINYHNSVMERALNAARAQVEVAVNIFNAQVAAYNARHQRYQIEAQVFEARVRAELTKVEIYKAQIDGMNALVNLNRSRVELYNAQLDGIKSLVDRYRVQVDAYNVMANVEKLRTDIFRSEVEAFIGTVQAKEAEFKAYEAAIRGEVARVDAYKAEAEAYKAQVEGLKAKVEAERAEVEAVVSKNRGVIDAFEAEAQSLNTLRQAQLSYNQNLATIYQSDVQRFAAEAQALTQAYELSSRMEEIEYRVQLEALQASIENAKNQLYRALEISKVRMESLRAAGDVHRSLAAAALSAINCNASLSDSVGFNISKSGNLGVSYSYSESYGEGKQCSTSYGESKTLALQESYSESVSNMWQSSDSFTESVSASTALNQNYNYNYDLVQQAP